MQLHFHVVIIDDAVLLNGNLSHRCKKKKKKKVGLNTLTMIWFYRTLRTLKSV